MKQSQYMCWLGMHLFSEKVARKAISGHVKGALHVLLLMFLWFKEYFKHTEC